MAVAALTPPARTALANAARRTAFGDVRDGRRLGRRGRRAAPAERPTHSCEAARQRAEEGRAARCDATCRRPAAQGRRPRDAGWARVQARAQRPRGAHHWVRRGKGALCRRAARLRHAPLAQGSEPARLSIASQPAESAIFGGATADSPALGLALQALDRATSPRDALLSRSGPDGRLGWEGTM